MRSRMLTVAIATALGLVGFGVATASAQDASSSDTSAKPHKHHSVSRESAAEQEAAANAEEVRLLKAQLAQLQQQVSELEQRTDAQSQINVATNQQVAEADKKVAAADKYVSDAKAGKIDYKGITITPGGFIEAAGFYRSKNEGGDVASSWSAIPFKSTNTSNAGEMRFSARQSRLSLLAQGDLSPDTHLAAYYEMDFLGAAQTANMNESNSFTPRTRVVYTTVDWSDLGLHLLAGDNWSLLTLNKTGITPRTEALPPTIDAQYLPGFTWARQPGVRLVKDWNQTWWLGVSLENAATTVGGKGTGVYSQTGGVNYNSANAVSLNDRPDLIAKFAMDPGFGHYEVFGINRAFLSRSSGTSNNSSHGNGFGIGMLLPLVPKVLDFQFSGMHGKGIGRYGSAGLPDATYNPDGSLEPIKETMLLAGLTLHPAPDFDVYAYGGQEREQKTVTSATTGLGLPTLVNSGCNIVSGTCQGNTRKVTQETVGFYWRFYHGPMGKLQFGAQYSHTERELFPGVGGGPTATDNMFFTNLRYYPF